MENLQQSDNIQIIQIYSFKNPVSNFKARPVVHSGIPYVTFSKYYNNIVVLSALTTTPYNDRVVCIKAVSVKQYYKNIVIWLKQLKTLPKIIEIHQDAKLIKILFKYFKNRVQINLIKHGTYLVKSYNEKFKFVRIIYEKIFLSKVTYVFCISDHVANTLKKQYPRSKEKFITIYNTYGYILESDINKDIKKENIITFASKPLKYKGIFVFFGGVSKFLNTVANWKAIIIGARFSNKSKYGKVLQCIQEKHNKEKKSRFIFYENLLVKDVFFKLKKAKILVVPSMHKEPFGLISLEGHLAGCIVVTSGTGGLKEISENNAYYLDKVTNDCLLKTLTYILNNIEEAEEKALLGKRRVLEKFNPELLVQKLDKIRKSLIDK